MRPTRLGRDTPYRSGRVFVGVGVNPELPTADPADPIDRASAAAGGEAFIPFDTPTQTIYYPEIGGAADPGSIFCYQGNATGTCGGWQFPTYQLAAGGAQGGKVDRAGHGALGNFVSWEVQGPATVTIHIFDGGTGTTYDLAYTPAGGSTTTESTLPAGDKEVILTDPVLYEFMVSNILVSGLLFDGVTVEHGADDLLWISAPFTIDGDDDTKEEVLESSVLATAGPFWRGTLADSYFIASMEALVAFADAGSVTVLVQAGNESDYSDAVTVATITETATGSYTADTLTASWAPSTVYQYWQLVLDTTEQDINVHEVHLYDPPEFSGAHEDLTGREDADQHPADSVSYDNTTSGLTATEVQAAIDEVAAAPGSSGGMVLLEQHTASSSAQLDFTTFISSTYDTYEFVFVNIIPATAGDLFRMRMGTGGTPTYDTGNNYGSSSFEWRAGGSAAGGSEGGVAFINLVRNGISTTTANWSLQGTVRLYNPGGAKFKWVNGNLAYLTNAGGTFRVGGVMEGTYESTTAVTAIRFFMSTGNIASGTIRVYGIEK